MVSKETVESVTESVWTRAITRGAMVLLPTVILPGCIWLVSSWLTSLDTKFISVVAATERGDAALQKQIEAAADRSEAVQTQNIHVQSTLTQTLADVQRAAAAQTATSNAQYNELKDDVRDNEHRLDRLEDRFPGVSHD